MSHDPKNRPMTRLAVGLVYGSEGMKALDEARCPSCGEKITEFRDDLSRKEYTLSGLCQACQDTVFGPSAQTEDQE